MRASQRASGVARPSIPAWRRIVSEHRPTRRIDDIVIGDRHRRDMGGIVGLAASMDENIG